MTTARSDPGGAQGGSALAHRRVVAVVAAKGGVGASFIAANLAALVAAEGHQPTLVLDLAGSDGDIASYLGIQTAHIAPVEIDPRDPAKLLAALDTGPGGVRLMSSARLDLTTRESTRRDMRTLCNALRVLFDAVVIDIPRRDAASLAALLAGADDVAVVSGMSKTAVRNTKRLLDALGALDEEVALKRRSIVLNRNEANTDLDRAGVESILGAAASVQLPYDATLVGVSVNSGEPIALHKPDAQVTRRLRELAVALGLLRAGDRVPEVGDAERDPDITRGRSWRGRFGSLTRR